MHLFLTTPLLLPLLSALALPHASDSSLVTLALFFPPCASLFVSLPYSPTPHPNPPATATQLYADIEAREKNKVAEHLAEKAAKAAQDATSDAPADATA